MFTKYRWQRLLALSGLLALGFSSCASDGPVSASTTVAPPETTAGPTTSVPTATSAPETPDAPDPARHITVTGTGLASGAPDSVTLTMGVEVVAATTTEVLDSVSTKSDALVAYLRGAGIASEDLQTTNLSVYPNYVYDGVLPGGSPAISGYTANVTLSVRVGELAQASTLVDGAAFTVGDALRLQGLMWSISDSGELLATARAEAIDDARSRASQFAQAAGWTLGSIESIEESPGTYAYGEGDSGSGSIPFTPGSSQLTVTAIVVFSVT